MLRLNVAIAPTATAAASILGVVGGDNAGFPNGRRVFDDVVSIELKAVAGALLGDVVKSFTPDAAAGALFDVGREPSPRRSRASGPSDCTTARTSRTSPTRGTGTTTRPHRSGRWPARCCPNHLTPPPRDLRPSPGVARGRCCTPRYRTRS